MAGGGRMKRDVMRIERVVKKTKNNAETKTMTNGT